MLMAKVEKRVLLNEVDVSNCVSVACLATPSEFYIVKRFEL